VWLFLNRGAARSRILLRDKDHRRLEVSYLAQPGGGEIEVTSAASRLAASRPAADAKQPGFAVIDLHRPRATSSFRLNRTGQGVRDCAREGPAGVVYDSLGMNGASPPYPPRIFDEREWGRTVAAPFSPTW